MKRFLLCVIFFLIASLKAGAAEYREIERPDTLDLAARAELSREVILDFCENRTEQKKGLRLPPQRFSCGPKDLEALVLLRAMNGPAADPAREAAAVKGFEDELGEDGLFYGGGNGKSANHMSQGRIMLAWMALKQLDGDPRYDDHLKKIAATLSRIAIRQENYAYFPLNNYYTKGKGWSDTREPEVLTLKPGQVPHMGDREGQNDIRCSIPINIGAMLRPLPLWYEMSGDTATLTLARDLTRYLTRPVMWQTFGEPQEMSGPAHAHYSGQSHSHLTVLRGVLDYAHVAGDTELMQFCRSGYEYTRNFGIPEIGWIPEWTNNNGCEACDIADYAAMAIRMSDYGVGDYWEDVDRAVRNQLMEAQILSGNAPEMYGTFSCHTTPNMTAPRTGVECCTPNSVIALYHVWESILRYRNGTAQVNLLLNRSTPWMDVASYLPYEGKVVLKNREARRASVRIPLWVERRAVRCRVGEKAAEPVWVGNYLIFEGIEKNQEITIEFPMREHTLITHPLVGSKDGGAGSAHDISYEVQFRGNTVISVRIAAGPTDRIPWAREDVIPLYQRESMRQPRAPMIKKKVYVSDVIPEW